VYSLALYNLGMPPPLSSFLVRLLYVMSWPALAGSIFFGGYSCWYLNTHNSYYGLTDLAKMEVIRMKENCLWADIGWLTVVVVSFILLKALYFVLKDEPQAGDRDYYDRFCVIFTIAFAIIGIATLFAFALI